MKIWIEDRRVMDRRKPARAHPQGQEEHAGFDACDGRREECGLADHHEPLTKPKTLNNRLQSLLEKSGE